MAQSSGIRAAFNLSAAFVNQTSGNAVAIRFMAQTTDPIDELYVFLDSVGGTLANITMECVILNEQTSTRPNTTVRDTSTAATMPAAADMWIKFAFGTPYTPAIGEILWLVITNTSADPATDYPGILTAPNVWNSPVSGYGYSMGYTTTGGFSAAGTTAPKMPFVIKAGSNYFGQPFTITANSYYTSNQLIRGIQITPTEDVQVNGAAINAGGAQLENVTIYADATAPGGSALATYDLDSTANATTSDQCGGITFTPYTLTGGVTYKVTVGFNSNNQNPQVYQIEDYSSYSAVFDAIRANDTIGMPWSVIDDAGGGWTIDKAVCPSLALYIVDNPAQAAGGASPRFGDMTGGKQ